jgi:hypothetical protein
MKSRLNDFVIGYAMGGSFVGCLICSGIASFIDAGMISLKDDLYLELGGVETE